MIAANPFDRQNSPVGQLPRRLDNRIGAAHQIALVIRQHHLWPADRAGVGLGMKTAVERVVVL